MPAAMTAGIAASPNIIAMFPSRRCASRRRLAMITVSIVRVLFVICWVSRAYIAGVQIGWHAVHVARTVEGPFGQCVRGVQDIADGRAISVCELNDDHTVR